MGTLVSNLRVKTNNKCTNLCICIMHVSKLKAHLHKQKKYFSVLDKSMCVYVSNVHQGSYMQRCLESIKVSGIHCTKYFFPFFFFNKCSRTGLWYTTVIVSPSEFNAIWQKPLWISTVGGQAYMAFNHILLCT